MNIWKHLCGAFVALILSAGFVAAGCSNFTLTNKQGHINLARDIGVVSTTLSGRNMQPCIKWMNHGNRVLKHIQTARYPATVDLLVFYERKSDHTADAKATNFTQWDVRLWAIKDTRSRFDKIVADFRTMHGVIPTKATHRVRIPNWGVVNIHYLYGHKGAGQVITLAYFETAPSPNSYLAQNGVRLIGGQTKDMVVSADKKNKAALFLTDVLLANYMPPVHNDLLATLRGN